MIRGVLVLALAVFLTILVHEAAHYVAAWLVGAPLDTLDVGLCGGNPCVRHPAFPGWRGAIVGYAGGLTASVCLGTVWVLLLRRMRATPSQSDWAYGLIVGCLSWYQFGNGLMEGLYRDRYVRGSVETNVSIVLFSLLGIGLHYAITWQSLVRWRRLRAADQARRRNHL